MIKLSLTRTYTIPYDDGDISFSVTFKFPDPREIRTEGVENPVKHIYDIIRDSIVGCYDFIDEDTSLPISVVNENGDVEPKMQQVVFDVIRFLTDYMEKVMTAVIGPTGKNFLAGVRRSSSGTGTKPDASPASKESATQETDASLSQTTQI